jgi:hypothetical protein
VVAGASDVAGEEATIVFVGFLPAPVALPIMPMTTNAATAQQTTWATVGSPRNLRQALVLGRLTEPVAPAAVVGI